MNDSIEQVMKAWRPRTASSGLRSRIFASEPEASPETGAARAQAVVFDWAGLMRWLVPATGCFVLATATFVHPVAPTIAAGPGSLERQGIALSMASARHDFNKMNNVPATTLEWTFGQRSASSNDSLAGSETNLLSK